MPNLNKVMLMGNITRDPELRSTSGGTSVCEFGIAINRRRKGSEKETCFVDVTAWGRQAEVIAEHLSKGRPIFIEGRLQLDQWTTQDGSRRSKLKVVLESFEFLGGRGEQADAGSGSDEAPPF